jgi:Na+-driven multidrug efflux pump
MPPKTILSNKDNPLSFAPIGPLLFKFALPSVLSFLVGSIYNIVDQIYLGHLPDSGMLGVAATNIAFPLNIITAALALLLAIGTASGFNLRQGAGNIKEATAIAGSGLFCMAAGGLILAVFAFVLNDQLVTLFGATPDIRPYAKDYMLIISFGLPFQVMVTGCTQLIRSDGKPTYAMVCMMSGMILNVILDPIFIFGLNMGVSGAALATVLSQILNAGMCIYYMRFKFRSALITRKELRFNPHAVKIISSLGMAACANQLAIAVVQLLLNTTLAQYGALSEYGAEVPLACVGAISKLNSLFFAFTIGISQGCQPIFSFNYGAKNYARVRKTYGIGVAAVTAFSLAVFAVFQSFPREILSIFGDGGEQYFKFGEQYIRVFFFMMFANGIQPVTSNFLTSMGKARVGIFISLTRNIIFFVPLILALPLVFGINGVLYAGPIADGAAVITAAMLGIYQVKKLKWMEIERIEAAE